MFLRMECVHRVGAMDEAFYMHMEEIDLCWRIHLSGYRVRSVPDSVVYHFGGWSLSAESYRKAYLNHRNQLVMMLKNLSPARLAWVFPARVCLELSTLLLGLFRLSWRHPVAALAALAWLVFHPGDVIRRRRQAQAVRRVTDRDLDPVFYPGSVVARYFLFGDRAASALPSWAETGRAGRE